MQIHPVFSPNKLQKVTMNPLPEQQALKSEPIKIDSNKEWKVDEILTI